MGWARDAYANEFAGWWGSGEPFIIVEQDVVPWPGADVELADCPEPWCAFSYYAHDRELPKPYLGCAKFRPDGPPPFEKAPDDILRAYVDGGLPHWQAIDMVVSASLKARGWHCHQHFPAVAHVKPPNYPLPSVGFIGKLEAV